MISDKFSAQNTKDISKISIKNENIYSCKIELCETCNWRCEHCYNSAHSNKGLSKNKIFSLLEELRELGCYEIIYTGGEIFTRTDAMEIIEKTRNMGFEVVLLTNISLLNFDIIKKLNEIYISKISCTVFSLDNKIHDSITSIKGSLNKVIKNMELIKESNILLEVKTPVMKKNFNELSKITDFCNRHGFKHYGNLDISEKRNGNEEPLKFQIGMEEKKKLIRYTDKLKGYKPIAKKKSDYFCEKMRNSIMIQVSGNICICPQYPYSFGNINDKRIKNIWEESERLRKLRNLKWKDIEVCWSCRTKDYCIRCPQHAVNFNAALSGKNKKTCDLAAITKEVYTSIID